jgi:hypothetical protein
MAHLSEMMSGANPFFLSFSFFLFSFFHRLTITIRGIIIRRSAHARFLLRNKISK